jgi:formylglycine-generating enzyme required for sulfatase activity
MSAARLIACLVALLLPVLAWSAEPRIALVIGNSEYASGPLPNPANDAKLIGEALTALGFEVIARRNADQNAMKRAIQEFGTRLEKAGPDAVGLFYYAGHGAQLNGRNYLVPVAAQINREADMDIEAVSADWVIQQMRYARNRLNIVILDACRNNPFTRSMRSADRGLAVMDAPAGILIAYSTAPGSVAADGDGRNSPYSEALARAMREMNEPVEQVFKRTRVAVMNKSGGKQIPWESSSLTGDFFFSGQGRRNDAPGVANVSATPPPQPTPAAPVSRPMPVVPVTATTRPTTTPTNAPPPSDTSGSWLASVMSWFSSTSSGGATIPGVRAQSMLQSLGVEASGIDGTHSYAAASLQPLIGSAPRRVTLGSTPEQIRAAYAMCRTYSAACRLDWYADEGLRVATLSPFELDVAPVTLAEFRQFVDATRYRTDAEVAGFAYALESGGLKALSGGSWRNAVSKRAVTDDAAVVGVSYQDASAYCRYRGARLPTEDEWEYAARGPERLIFPWGDNVEPVSRSLTTPPAAMDGVAQGLGGRYRGLSGNVWQWVDSTVEGRKVLKGGSWLEPNPANKRPAARRYEIARRADEDSGFRCARTVPAWPDAQQRLTQLTN